jgi:AcrR family transcriptional regulator
LQEESAVSAEAGPAPRKPRADSVRNREILMEAAKAGFTEVGSGVSLEEIARRAGVGIGTLYRHFPTRDELIGAVYQRELQQIADAAEQLLATKPAGDALHQWMRLFVDYIGTKKLIAAALNPATLSDLYAKAGSRIPDCISLMVGRARAAGEIRDDVEPGDVLRALAGLTYGNTDPDWQASALRLIDVLMAGMRVTRG